MTVQEITRFGTLISSVELKNGSTMFAYRDGNAVNLVVNGVIEKSFTADNVGEIVAALGNESDF